MKPLYRNPLGTLWANLGVLITLPAFAAAQEWTRAASVDDVATAGHGPASATARDANDLDLEQVIVTAVSGNPSSKLNSSLSVSTLTQDEITQSDPSNAAGSMR